MTETAVTPPGWWHTGDEAAISMMLEAYRPELQAHCYRLLGSLEDAEDQVQETFLRAWRSRTTYQRRATLRAWLYRIATNACYDALERRRRALQRIQATDDQTVDQIAATVPDPEAELVAKETFEPLFSRAVNLPPRQVETLFLRCVAGLSAKETAALLDANVAAVNSALQRARETLRGRMPEQRLAWRRVSNPVEARAAIRRLIDAAVTA